MRPSVLPSCVSSREHCSTFWPRGGCPFTVSFRGVLGRGSCSCLLSGGIYIPCRTICKPGLSLLFICRLTFDNSPSSHRSGWEREDGVARVGTVGMWATCPRRACSHTFHFPLLMGCCPACPTSWPDGTDNTQFTMAAPVTVDSLGAHG